MGMDRNTVIGFVLIGALLIGMFYINTKSSNALQAQRQHEADSAMAVKRAKDSIANLANKADNKLADSVNKAATQLPASFTTDTTEHLTTLENDVLAVVFTNKGAQPKSVELKQFKTFDGKKLLLQTGNFNKLSYKINAGGHE